MQRLLVQPGATATGIASKTSSKTESVPPKITSDDSNTVFGGVVGFITHSGGGGGGSARTTKDLTSSPSSSLKSGGDSPGSASGLNNGFAVVLSVAAFGIGFCVIYMG